jgi:hypothetical protein
MKCFSGSALIFAVLTAYSAVTNAQNISLNIAYTEGKNGVSFSPTHAQTGTFALTPSQPTHATGGNWRVVAKDSNNQIVYETTVRDATKMRVEMFNPKTRKIVSSKTVSKGTGEFQVSIPFTSNVASVEVLSTEKNIPTTAKFGVLPGQTSSIVANNPTGFKFDRSTLESLANRNTPTASFGSKSVTAAAVATPSTKPKLTTVVKSGASNIKMDYVLIGDGYTAAEMSKWNSDAKKLIDALMKDKIFAANRSSVNVHRVDVVSKQSGVDVIHKRIYKDTALDGEIGCYNIERTLCVNETKVSNVLRSLLSPDARDVVIVISNSKLEGGAASGDIAALTMDQDVVEVLLHEIGHAAFNLADEYEEVDPGSCDLSSEPTTGNASKNATRKVKWGKLIAASTVVPTPVGKYPNGTVGVFTGADYCNNGKYRPTENSRMRELNQPWHAVNEGLARDVFAQYIGTAKNEVTQKGTIQQGGYVYAPSASPNSVQAGKGVYRASLTGPIGSNFDLELYKWTDTTWSKVAKSTSSGSTETINYTGTTGAYYLQITAVKGSGSYTVKYNFPKP